MMMGVHGRFSVRVEVHSVSWNCSGKKLASGSADQTAWIWHVEPHSFGMSCINSFLDDPRNCTHCLRAM